MNDEEYKAECERLCKLEEVQRVIESNPELNCEFLGFLGDYRKFEGKLPECMPIIDLGCNSAIQAVYFQGHMYVGVDDIPITWRYRADDLSVKHVRMSIQDYCRGLGVIECPFNPSGKREDVFAFCCNVPDNEESEIRELVRKTFRYYCITYPGTEPEIVLPEGD